MSFPEQETDFVIPRAIIRTAADGALSAQETFNGGAYRLYRPMTINRLIFRVTAENQDPSGKIGIYQKKNGVFSTSIPLVGSVSDFAAVGNTNFIETLDEGEIFLDAGIFFVLCGKNGSGGSFSFRAYSVNSFDFFNSNMPAVVNKYMANFTTSKVVSSGLPSTLDPRETGDGGDCTPSTSNTAPVVALAFV